MLRYFSLSNVFSVLLLIVTGISIMCMLNVAVNSSYETIDTVEDEHQGIKRRVGSSTSAEEEDAAQDDLTKHICSPSTRKEHLRSMCKEMGLVGAAIPWTDLGNRYWIVDDVHKVFYCLVPKTATHTLRSLLAEPLIGKLNASTLYPMRAYLHATGFRFLYEIERPERREIMKSYKKMLVVRHPLDRLHSAYVNKLGIAGGLNTQILSHFSDVVQNYLRERGRLGDSIAFNPDDMTISFDELLDLIIIHRENFTDEHWKSVYDTCYPCTIPYDNIMKVETLDHDIRRIYSYLGFSPETQLGHGNHGSNIAPTDKLKYVKQAFDVVGKQSVKDIVRLYRNDLKLFGYTWDPYEGAGCKINKIGSGEETCC